MKILIVDDNKDILLLVKTILELSNFDATTVDNGKDALALCKKNQYSLIFLDLMMDGMDGYTVVKELRKNTDYQQTPVIALTAKAYHKDKETVLANGFTDHLSKPFRTEDILNATKKYSN
ncbi:MAG: response regulator [Candidatus Margulisbacteria bacterium]|nr:response regulator [Candidatus Margulisiibacteriota bacterium]